MVRFLVEEVLERKVAFVQVYGNTLMGLAAWDGASEVKPFQEAGTRIIEGVY
jgi:hypothetical protein